MRIRTAAAALFGVTVFLAVAGPAAAQSTIPVDVSAGYQFTRLLDSDAYDGTNVPTGWTASLTAHFHPAVNLVGEVNGAYRDGGKLHNFLTGLRVGGGRSPATNEALVFGQFLVGVGRSSGDNALLIQPGAGLDIRGAGRLGTRLNVDYILARSDGATNKGFRIAAGLVFDLKR